MIRRLAVNTASNFAFRGFSMVLSIVTIPVLVNAVGADGYGIILLAQSVLGYFSLLNSGVPASTIKYVAEYEAKGDREMVDGVIASSFVFFLGAGVIIALGVGIFAALGGITLFQIEPARQQAATNVLYIAAVAALFSRPLVVLDQILEGLQRYPENKLAMGIGDLTNKIGTIAAALLGAPIEIIFLCANLGLILKVPVQYRAIRRIMPGWAVRVGDFKVSTLKMIFGYSIWMLLGQMAGVLIYQTDRILLGLFLPVASLTVYQVVMMPFTFIKTFSSLYNSAMTPAVSAAEATHGRKGLDTFIYTLSRYSNAFVAVMAVVGTYLSAPFIGLWMGPEYVPYAWIAQMGCLFQMLWQANSTLGRVFYGSGKVRRITLISLVLAVLNVPLGIWGVQTIGVAGVVLSTIFVGVVGVPLQYLMVMPELDIDRRRYFLDSILLSQWPAWTMGLLLIPLWPAIQEIDSWVALAATALGLGLTFAAAMWFAAVKPQHRQFVYSRIPMLRH